MLDSELHQTIDTNVQAYNLIAEGLDELILDAIDKIKYSKISSHKEFREKYTSLYLKLSRRNLLPAFKDAVDVYSIFSHGDHHESTAKQRTKLPITTKEFSRLSRIEQDVCHVLYELSKQMTEIFYEKHKMAEQVKELDPIQDYVKMIELLKGIRMHQTSNKQIKLSCFLDDADYELSINFMRISEEEGEFWHGENPF